MSSECVTENPSAARALDRLLSDIGSDRQKRQMGVDYLGREFKRVVAKGDMRSTAYFAPRETSRVDGTGRLQHCVPYVHEVIADALDCKDFMERAMAALVRAAATDPLAAALLKEAGASWADSEADFL